MSKSPSTLLLACAFIALALCLSSCRYGLNELFYRSDPPGQRFLESSDRDCPTIAANLGGSVNAWLKANPGKGFSFIIASDLHFGKGASQRKAALDAFKARAAASGAAFALFDGDLVDTGTAAEYQAMTEWASSLRTGEGAPQGGGQALPWFASIGNHDLYNGGWRFFKKCIGPSSWKFSVGGLSFYLIDSGSGAIGQGQLERVSRDMSADAQPKIVLSHYPIRGGEGYRYYRITNPRERAVLLELFHETGVELLLCGHYHRIVVTDCGSFDERIVGSLVDSNVDGKAHFAVVRVSASGAIEGIDTSIL
jgi:3',5'-cyclic AMP phosphodiesterase CpdA